MSAVDLVLSHWNCFQHLFIANVNLIINCVLCKRSLIIHKCYTLDTTQLYCMANKTQCFFFNFLSIHTGFMPNTSGASIRHFVNYPISCYWISPNGQYENWSNVNIYQHFKTLHKAFWAIANIFLAFIGKIILKIPWKNLTKESIIVTIEDVYVLAGPVSG